MPWSESFKSSPCMQAAKAHMRLHGDTGSRGPSKLKEPKPHELKQFKGLYNINTEMISVYYVAVVQFSLIRLYFLNYSN